MLRAIPLLPLAASSLLLIGSQSWAAPKTIAIVNLSKHAASGDAAAKARKVLDQIEELRPTTPGDLARALEDLLPDGGPDGSNLAAAQHAIATSEAAFSAFQSSRARSELDTARRLLFGLAPSKHSTRLLADVSFHMALIHLRDENRGLAMGELQLLHRLDEKRSIDPVRYPPDVVRAFNHAAAQARVPSQAKHDATVSISATYDGAPIYVDGKVVGESPSTISLSPGMHILAVSAPQYQASARRLEVDPDGTMHLQFDLEPRSPVVRALELRFEASAKGLQDEHLRTAAARVSRLVGSDAVLVILDDGEQAAAALYIQHLDRLSFRHDVDSDLKKMLGLVIDVASPTLLEGPGGSEGVPWYRSTIAISAAIGTVALSIVGFFTIANGDDTRPDRRGVPQWF